MSNNYTIIRNKLSITKVLLSLAISISVGNSMFYTDPDDYYGNYYKNLMIPLNEQEESIFDNSGFENNLLNDSNHINKHNIKDNTIIKNNDDDNKSIYKETKKIAMNNNLNLDLMKNDTSRNNIIPLNEDLDEYNATKNKNIKNKKIFKIVKKNKKYNSKINELGNINGPENINELNNNIDKNNTIFNEINNGKYDNIAKLFTTELLNSLTNKQIEQLKGAI